MCEQISRTAATCLCLLFLVGIAAAIGYYFARPKELENIRWPTLEDFHIEGSTFNATSPEDAARWENNGQGLYLEMLNALETRWYPYLEAAMTDWNSGYPDTLDLNSSIIDYEFECTPVEGRLKVCNGDYGETGWRGINTALLTENNIITASAAKMNEYYLSNANGYLKQYTMCHEIGHGFGLPHSDESFWNRDLGNCMDYTNNPQVNMHPDSSNFEFLYELYGAIPNSNNTAATLSVIQTDDYDVGYNYEDIPTWVVDTWIAINHEFQNIQENSNFAVNSANGGSRWRLLHASAFAQVHEIYIGEGYKLRVQLLMADYGVN